MTVVTVHQAKTNLSRLLKKASNGEEVIIARGSSRAAQSLWLVSSLSARSRESASRAL